MRWLPVALAVLRGRADTQDAPGAEASVTGEEVSPAWNKNPWPYNKFHHVYVASLARDAYRVRRMRDVLMWMHMPDYEVWDASDGMNVNQVPPRLLPSLHRVGNGCSGTWIPDVDMSFSDRPWAFGEQEATLGCYLTHLRMLKDAMKKGYSSVLIFEDDLDPASNVETRFQMVRTMPDSWDMVYLGWHQHTRDGPGPAHAHSQRLAAWDCMPWGADGLCRLKKPVLQQTHALAINGKAIPKLVKFLEDGLKDKNACAVDQMYKAYQIQHPYFQVFAAQQPVFEQMSAKDLFPSQITPRSFYLGEFTVEKRRAMEASAVPDEQIDAFEAAAKALQSATSSGTPREKLKKLLFR